MTSALANVGISNEFEHLDPVSGRAFRCFRASSDGHRVTKRPESAESCHRGVGLVSVTFQSFRDTASKRREKTAHVDGRALESPSGRP